MEESLMCFVQKVNQWLQSGSGIVRVWKYTIVVFAMTYPIVLIWEPFVVVPGIALGIAVVSVFLWMADLSVKGGAQINAEEYFRVQEERGIKKE